MSTTLSRKLLLKYVLIAEALLYLTAEVFDKFDTARPFIEHMNAWLLGPGFLGTMFLLLYHDHENAMIFKRLSMFFMIISAFVYALLLYPVLKFGFTETTPLNIPFIIILNINLILNIVVVFQYKK
ncbi:hypothetical protein K3G63_05505 [Hymenobacter sp. HSC-4F20]|uniref:hypothetical protein n=1 Tax=Hymenobacter sp. HSC-4F20 TaxID=2864135 RepID=UPI001C737A17|nr:hypothetical protein [Hymenobacter sp. HSC-4F20]MBX0289884.1 hypothetical protein [Hymenobacter sp. HSC-4F20]